MSVDLDKLPQLLFAGMRTALYAYRIEQHGIYFIEANDSGENANTVQFITNGVILNPAGQSFRDEAVGHLLAANAINALAENADELD